ncbi:MAG: EVE domain-containing protein [Flavobacteriales bacterium]|nr:EVE domain-containing protein [Flavobacteriales bacterium]
MNYWLVKSEPSVYAWDQLLKDGTVVWDGVRNYTARNNLRAMKKGDQVLFYHSNEGLSIMGIARVRRVAYPDPTDSSGIWSSVDLEPVQSFQQPISLKTLKADLLLSNMQFVKQARLSVSSVTPDEFERIKRIGL